MRISVESKKSRTPELSSVNGPCLPGSPAHDAQPRDGSLTFHTNFVHSPPSSAFPLERECVRGQPTDFRQSPSSGIVLDPSREPRLSLCVFLWLRACSPQGFPTLSDFPPPFTFAIPTTPLFTHTTTLANNKREDNTPKINTKTLHLRSSEKKTEPRHPYLML